MSVDENASGAVIGALTVSDPNTLDGHTFSVSDTRFEVVGGELKLKAEMSLDYEAGTSVNLDVTATDIGGLSHTESFTLTVNNVNESPTDLALDNASIEENAVGATIGTLAVLTKQEFVLILVGGLFVTEAVSVILQIAFFRLRGRRVFRMAPLHHHFELAGWPEIRVTIRFWILAVIFALLSLSTLKLR